MKRLIYIIVTCILTSCSQPKNKVVKFEDNLELIEMVSIDQKMRNDDTSNYEAIDQKHRERVFELLAENKIKTEKDKYNGALLLQHTNAIFCDGELKSISPENFLLAYSLSKSAFESGYKNAGYMVALNYDRYLLYTKGYQKYGTQKIYDEKLDDFLWAPIDSLTTDEERLKYNVPLLRELLSQSKMKTK